MMNSSLARTIGTYLFAISSCLGPSLSEAALVSISTSATSATCTSQLAICQLGIADTQASGAPGDIFELIIKLPSGTQMTLTSIDDPAYVGAYTEIGNDSEFGYINLTPRIALGAANGTPLTSFSTGSTLSIGFPGATIFSQQTVLPTSWVDIPFQSLIIQYETQLTSGSVSAITAQYGRALFEEVQGTVGPVGQAPEPSALWLLSSGMLAFLAVSWRKIS